MKSVVSALILAIALLTIPVAAAAAESQPNKAAYLGWEEMLPGKRYVTAVGNLSYEIVDLGGSKVVKVNIFLAAEARKAKTLIVFLNLTGPQYQVMLTPVDPNRVEHTAYFSIPDLGETGHPVRWGNGIRNIAVYPSNFHTEEGFFYESMVPFGFGR